MCGADEADTLFSTARHYGGYLITEEIMEQYTGTITALWETIEGTNIFFTIRIKENAHSCRQ